MYALKCTWLTGLSELDTICQLSRWQAVILKALIKHANPTQMVINVKV